MSVRYGTYEEQFARKYEVNGSGCWLWSGKVSCDGYAEFSVDGQYRKAHRVAYEWWVGPIPDGYTIDHLCMERSCVNPAHLEAVTHAENCRRGLLQRKTCKQGHPRTPENTYDTSYIASDGTRKWRRNCRPCTIDAQRRYQARKKVA